MSTASARSGWVNEQLASLPTCPPFPYFTDFERNALRAVSKQFGEDEERFRQQLAASQVIDRINTQVGFYTRIIVDRSRCSPVPFKRQSEVFAVEGIPNGLGVIVWSKNGDGYLDTVEGWTVDDNPLMGRDLSSLVFLGPQKY